MTIEQIMEHLTISRRTLETRFREAFGHSRHDEVRQKIERAKQLLAETDLPVTEIAMRAGFCDRAHFGRAFSAATGGSATEYRNSFAPGRNARRHQTW